MLACLVLWGLFLLCILARMPAKLMLVSLLLWLFPAVVLVSVRVAVVAFLVAVARRLGLLVWTEEATLLGELTALVFEGGGGGSGGLAVAASVAAAADAWLFRRMASFIPVVILASMVVVIILDKEEDVGGGGVLLLLVLVLLLPLTTLLL